MSSHVSAKAINLHHKQVNEGAARREARQEARRQAYLKRRNEFRLRERIILGFTFFLFCYSMFITAVYMRWWIFN